MNEDSSARALASIVAVVRGRPRVRAGAANPKTPAAGSEMSRVHRRSVSEDSGGAGRRQHRRRHGQRRRHRDGGDRARRAGDEDRHGRGAACRRRRPPPDIEDARDKFGALSEAIVTYMTGLHLTPPEGVRVAFCPMVEKPWLQEGRTLANPYTAKRCRPAAASGEHSLHQAHAGQRPGRAAARGSRLSDRRREPLVSRRLEERAARATPASRICSST